MSTIIYIQKVGSIYQQLLKKKTKNKKWGGIPGEFDIMSRQISTFFKTFCIRIWPTNGLQKRLDFDLLHTFILRNQISCKYWMPQFQVGS